MRRYRSEANERWIGFEHRPGDIVVSTRSKCGTTWVQMICYLLVHQTPMLPEPLGVLSPWLDWEVEPLEAVRSRLDAQGHRRVIKTHTPLDGLPLHPEVTYVLVGRHPLDVAVSLFHHTQNLDRERMAVLTGEPSRPPEAGTLDRWLDRWIDDRTDPVEALDTLAGNVHHVSDAWGRHVQHNVVLVHYAQLTDDLASQIRCLAEQLRIEVDPERWPGLVAAARFDAMQERSSVTSPDHLGVLRHRGAFFRSGVAGDGTAACSPAQLERYRQRVTELAAPDVLAWLEQEKATNAGSSR